VALTVTDDDRATDDGGKHVTVTEGGGNPIALDATGYEVRGGHHADLTGTDAAATQVDVIGDGRLVATTPNGGFYTDAPGTVGGASSTY
jgi:hypothetical protein